MDLLIQQHQREFYNRERKQILDVTAIEVVRVYGFKYATVTMIRTVGIAVLKMFSGTAQR